MIRVPPSARRWLAAGGAGLTLVVAGAACSNNDMVMGETPAGVTSAPATTPSTGAPTTVTPAMSTPGTSTPGGSSSPSPTTTTPADVVAGVELRVHQQAGGCWQEFAPDAPAGSSRQDTWSPGCAGAWAVAVQVFSSPAALSAAALPAGSAAYRSGTVRVVVTPAAPAPARTAVSAEPGVESLGP